MIRRGHFTYYTPHYTPLSTHHNLSLFFISMVGRFSIFSLSAATVVMSLPQKRKKVVWFRT